MTLTLNSCRISVHIIMYLKLFVYLRLFAYLRLFVYQFFVYHSFSWYFIRSLCCARNEEFSVLLCNNRVSKYASIPEPHLSLSQSEVEKENYLRNC